MHIRGDADVVDVFRVRDMTGTGARACAGGGGRRTLRNLTIAPVHTRVPTAPRERCRAAALCFGDARVQYQTPQKISCALNSSVFFPLHRYVKILQQIHTEHNRRD